MPLDSKLFHAQLSMKFQVVIKTKMVKKKTKIFFNLQMLYFQERSCSVVECLIQDRGAAGSSLTGITGLCP